MPLFFYSYFASMGIDVTPEDRTNRGSMDLSLRTDDKVYIIEFKMASQEKSAAAALQQIKDKGYHEKYRADGKKIYLVGMVFSAEERNITNFSWELLP